MGAPATFDLITAFDAIHDQARPDAVLRNIAVALAPNGTFLMQDISGSSHVHTDIEHPFGPFLYTISCMHCMSVSLAAGGPGGWVRCGARRRRPKCYGRPVSGGCVSRRYRTTR
jgi:SAM-dependent methyltransferase